MNEFVLYQSQYHLMNFIINNLNLVIYKINHWDESELKNKKHLKKIWKTFAIKSDTSEKNPRYIWKKYEKLSKKTPDTSEKIRRV